MLDDFRSNVEQTFGAPFEFVVVDNTGNEYDIFSAYNYGVSRAKGEIVIFAHEDVCVETDGWGRRIADHMDADPDIGMIGFVGTQSIPKAPRGWAVCGQQGGNKWLRSGKMDGADGSGGKGIEQAMAVDGLLFAIRRELFDEGAIRFDGETFSGFHVYDMDISLQVARHKKVMVLLDIQFKHFFSGLYDRKYYTSYCDYYMKWKDLMPMSVHPLTDPVLFSQQNALHFFRGMYRSGHFSNGEMRSYVMAYLDTISDQRKTRFYYDIFYYTNFYDRPGLRRAGVMGRHIFRKMLYGSEK